SPDGKSANSVERMFTPQGERRRLAAWELPVGRIRAQKTFTTDPWVYWSDNGKMAAAVQHTELVVVDARSCETIFACNDTFAGRASFSPDGRLVAARRKAPETSDTTALGVWETATGKEIASFLIGKMDHIALAAGNRHLVATDAETISVWDLTTGNE